MKETSSKFKVTVIVLLAIVVCVEIASFCVDIIELRAKQEMAEGLKETSARLESEARATAESVERAADNIEKIADGVERLKELEALVNDQNGANGEAGLLNLLSKMFTGVDRELPDERKKPAERE